MVYSQFEQRNIQFWLKTSQEGFQWKWHNILLFQLFELVLYSAHANGSFDCQSSCWHSPRCTTTKEELKAYCPKIFTVMGGASRCDWSHFSSAVLLVSLAVFSLYWEQVFVFKGRLSLVLYVAAADNAFGTHCNFSACCTLPQWAVMSFRMAMVIAKIVLRTPNLIILVVVVF